MRTAMIAIVLGLGLGGCKPAEIDGAAAASAEGAGGTASGGEPALGPIQALARKQSAYVQCLNRYSNDVLRGRRSWLESFPKGPSAKQASKTLYGPLALAEPKECREGITAARAMKPSLPALEAAGDAYLAAITALQPLTVRLREYFDQRDYKDDKLALAIELHPKLIAAYEQFLPADRALGAEVDRIEDRINAESLAELEKTEGKQLRWHHKRMLIEAKRVVALAAEARSPFELKDPAALQTALTALDTAATELLAYYGKHKETIEKRTLSYWTVENPIKSFLKDAKEMMRRHRDRRGFSRGELMTINASNAQSVDGHPARVIAAYNSLIDTSNRLRL